MLGAPGLRLPGRSRGEATVALLGRLSLGYRVRGAREGKNRELADLELVEVSLVTFPMQPGGGFMR